MNDLSGIKAINNWAAKQKVKPHQRTKENSNTTWDKPVKPVRFSADEIAKLGKSKVAA